MSKTTRKRGVRSVATLDVEKKIASSKRTLQDVQRIIDQAKKEDRERRGGELVGKIPPMFLEIPGSVIGGAESYFQEILSSVPKAFNYIFGRSKGARQLQIDAFLKFDAGRDVETEEDLDYITIASAVAVLVAYHCTQAIGSSTTPSVISDIISGHQNFVTEVESGKSITDALKSTQAIVSASTGLTKLGQLVYPLNPAYLATRDKMVASKKVSNASKADFLMKTEVLNAYRRYAVKTAPKDSVALPSQITKQSLDNPAIAYSSTSNPRKASNLVKWFKDSSQYSLEDSFKFYRDAYNALSGTRASHRQSKMKDALRVIRKTFDKFVDAVKDSLFDSSVVGEVIELKDVFFEIMSETAGPDDFLLAQAVLTQAESTDALKLDTNKIIGRTAGAITRGSVIDVKALGYDVISDLDLIDLLAEASETNVSETDKDVWRAWQKIKSVFKDLQEEALSVDDRKNIEDLLDEAVADVQASPLDNITSDFTKMANDALSDLVSSVVDSFNTDFATELGGSGAFNSNVPVGSSKDVGQGIADALSGLFSPYTDGGASIITATVTSNDFKKLVHDSSVKFSNATILRLADGRSLDVYNEAADEFDNEEVDLILEELRSLFSRLKAAGASGLNPKLFSEVENFVVDTAIEAQVIFDSLHSEAERDPDIAIFENPGELSMGMQAGVGAGVFVGTHAITALTQRILNSDGKTSGGAFYAAESLPALIVAGLGGYHWHQDRKDIAIPVIGGAVASVILRVLTRKFNTSALRYLGAGPAAVLGDKTFGYNSWSAVSAGKPQATGDYLPISEYLPISDYLPISGHTSAGEYFEVPTQGYFPTATHGYVADDGMNGYVADDGMNGYVADDGMNGYVADDGMNGYVADDGMHGYVADDGMHGYVADDGMHGYVADDGMNGYVADDGMNGYVADDGMNGYQDSSVLDEYSLNGDMGEYVETPVNDPFYTYNPPTRTSFEQMQQLVGQEPRMYAAPAGLGGLGKYVSTPTHDPFYTYNPPTMIPFQQANQMLMQGKLNPSAIAAMSGADEEIYEILQEVQPMSKQEIMAEGLQGYITDTILKLAPGSAQKLQDAGAGSVIGSSRTTPGAVLMHIETTGEEGPITPEFNPSLPEGTFRPHQIRPAQDTDVVTSGLFSRGNFSSRLPSVDDGYDY